MRRFVVAGYLVLASAGFSAPGITAADFRDWKDVILPDAEESAWEKIPWRTSLWAGAAEAQKKGVPVLFFIGKDGGRPLGPGVPDGIEASGVWNDPAVRQLAFLYVAVADDGGLLIDDEGPEGEWFRKILHEAKGRGGEGVYLVAPGGALLGVVTPDGPAAVAEALKRGLAAWNALREQDRLGKPIDPADAAERPESRFPDEGLALVARAREPVPGRPVHWRKTRDAVWFSRAEAEELLPEDFRRGDRIEWPERLARRLACFPALAGAHLTSTVVSLEEGEVVLSVGGRAGNLVLTGDAVWDIGAERFTAFDLLAAADLRRDKDGPGFYWTLAEKGAIDRLAPSSLDDDWPEPDEE